MRSLRSKPVRLQGEAARRLGALIEASLGLDCPPERWPDLERAIDTLRQDTGAPDAETCLRALLSAPLDDATTRILARHLAVGESYFFREPGCWSALRDQILPQLVHLPRQDGKLLHIWSAGCATGEEP